MNRPIIVLAAMACVASTSCIGPFAMGDVVYARSATKEWRGKLEAARDHPCGVMALRVDEAPAGLSYREVRAATLFTPVLARKSKGVFLPVVVDRPRGQEVVLRGYLDYGWFGEVPPGDYTQFLVVIDGL